MNSLSLLALATLVTAPLTAQRTRTVVVIPGQLTTIVTDTMGTLYEVPFSTGRTYSAVLSAFSDLKLPAEVKDSSAGRVETNVFYRHGDLGGKQISTYLNCGDGVSGPYADEDRVYMIAMVTISPTGPTGSTIRTIFLAGSVAVAQGARPTMDCRSTGRLELRLHRLVLQKAAAAN
jgi:hypothetical protein